MANRPVSIDLSVGIRDGLTWQPNKPADVSKITRLFDRIKVSDGGSMEIGGLWATDEKLLIIELAAQIVTFQTTNNLPKKDGAIDPNGATLRTMNALATDDPDADKITATVVPAPDGLPEDVETGIWVAEPSSLPGNKPLQPMPITAKYVRKLVQVEGTSIKWFGLVVPETSLDQLDFCVPHVNFTPSPIQGGYQDASYSSFGGWGNLWRDYTSTIGGQVAASGVLQILVIPFYMTKQAISLGDFLINWQETLRVVIEAAINDINPYRINALGGRYTYDTIYTSSFSNGISAHFHFNNKGVGVGSATKLLFDLDGAAQTHILPHSSRARTSDL